MHKMFFKTRAFLQKTSFLNLVVIHHAVIGLESSTEEVEITFLQVELTHKVSKDFPLTRNIQNWLQDYDKFIKVFTNKSLVKTQTAYSARQTCAPKQPVELMNNTPFWIHAWSTHSQAKHTFSTAILSMRHREQFPKKQTVKNGSSLFSLLLSAQLNCSLKQACRRNYR